MKCWSYVVAVAGLAGGLVLAQDPPPAQTDGVAPASAGVLEPQRREVTSLEMLGRSGGSLFGASRAAAEANGRKSKEPVSFYRVPPPQPKELKKHDLIYIIINEESDISSDGKSDLKKSADFDAHLDELIKLKLKNAAIQGGAQGATPPSVKFGANRDLQGEGKLERKDQFTMRIAAEVVDVKPNHTVVIQATKTIKHDEEEQEYILTGICSSEAVTPDNSIMSWQVANVKIQSATKGAVTDTTNRGFIPKLLDFVNLF